MGQRKRRPSPTSDPAPAPLRVSAAAQRSDRRSSSFIRIPFIRRCMLDFGAGRSNFAFLVNLNVLGAYVAQDEQPVLGEELVCRFALPGNEREVVADSVVAWINTRQQHPVHSLPPGFGLKFVGMTAEDRGRIEDVIIDYVTRHPRPR
jgi:hypothetical protein